MADLDQYYRILGLEPNASPEKVKQAYRDLLWVWHPDRFEGKPRLQRQAQENLKEINNAYEKLQSAGTASSKDNWQEPRNSQRKSSEDEKKHDEQSATKPPPRQDGTSQSISIRHLIVLGFLLLVLLLALDRLYFEPKPDSTKPPSEPTGKISKPPEEPAQGEIKGPKPQAKEELVAPPKAADKKVEKAAPSAAEPKVTQISEALARGENGKVWTVQVNAFPDERSAKLLVELL